MPTFDVLEYGAAADGHTLDTTAAPSAIDACHAAGGGKTCLAGTPVVRSNVELHLERGPVRRASRSYSGYPPGLQVDGVSPGAVVEDEFPKRAFLIA
jgi:polygalacturonase